MTGQMVVTRNADGSHHPPYNEAWPELLQVEWAAGCAAADSGLRIEVKPASSIRTGVGYTPPEGSPEEYYLTVWGARTSTGGSKYTAQGVYAFLDGLQAGVTTTADTRESA